MKFNLKQFYEFCSQLKIETKEHGLKRMDKLLGTQTYVMDEITQGLEEDKHFFVILKGRQLGITTIRLPSTCTGTSSTQGYRGRSRPIQKRIGICLGRP